MFQFFNYGGDLFKIDKVTGKTIFTLYNYPYRIGHRPFGRIPS